jgi:GNAT superfamily N-acetyltransferase
MQKEDVIAIVEAASRPLLREFVELPYSMYPRSSHWVPPLRRDEYRRFSPHHNPFLEHATITPFLARANGETVGRVAAIEDRLHNEVHAERTVWFGFLEARDSATAAALLGAVETWGRDRGAEAIRGPANPSLNESVGLLVDGFDEDPYLLMPFNPPQYASFLEQSGYRKVKDLFAWTIDMAVPIGERLERVARRASRRHEIVIRPAELKEFERDLAFVQEIYRAAWSNNWGFVAPTEAEIRQLAKELRPVLDPEILLIAETGGRAVGCALAFPDINQVLKRMNGRLLPFGLVHFLRRRSIVNQARVALLGVLPEYRRSGLYPLLVAELHRRGAARGYRRAELSWTLEDNDAINAGIEAAGGRHHKTYRVYEKPLG